MKTFVLLQALKDTNTASVHGTYLDRKAAELAVGHARGSGFSPHREARYFIEEREVEEIEPLEEPKAESGESKPGSGVMPHPRTTFSESGEPLNQPNAPQFSTTKKDFNDEEPDTVDMADEHPTRKRKK